MNAMTKRTVYVVAAICGLGLLIVFYTGQVVQRHFAPMASLSPDHQPVKYKPSMDQGDLARITSSRKSTIKMTVGRMLKYQMYDDYGFCVKEAPFHGPFRFLKNSKNPCLNINGTFRCLPFFYLAGFSKSGTSDAFRKIVAHPDIRSSNKEMHWLDYKRYFDKGDDIEYYMSMFAGSSKSIKSDIDENGSSNIIFGDGTPCYLWHSLYWRCYEGNAGLTEPKYTNADVIHSFNPQSKIIVLMRDPVTRLYSRYLSWLKRLPEPEYSLPSPEKFHQLCTKAIELYRSCFKTWSHRHCAYNGTLYTLVKLRLQEGMYSIFLKDWLAVFPREQLLLFKFENYVKDIPGSLRKIYKFLEVEPLSNKTLLKIANTKTSNVGSNYHIGPMLDKTKVMLQAFYSSFNKDLQYTLNDPTWAWGYE